MTVMTSPAATAMTTLRVTLATVMTMMIYRYRDMGTHTLTRGPERGVRGRGVRNCEGSQALTATPPSALQLPPQLPLGRN